MERPIINGPVEHPKIDGDCSIDDIIDGDLVFCARPSALQSLCERAGEPWRHVGVATTSAGHVSIAEVSGARFGLRHLDDVILTNTVAVGRVNAYARPMAQSAALFSRSKCGDEQVYAWDDVILAGFIAATRRFCLPHDQSALERAVEVATSALRERPEPDGIPTYTCSSFVVAAFAESGCPLDFDLHLPRAEVVRPSLFELARGGHRPLRSGGGSRISIQQARFLVRAILYGAVAGIGAKMPSDIHDDAYRWVTPGDLWRSNSLVERYLVTHRVAA